MKLYAIGKHHQVQLPPGAGYRWTWPYREFFHGDYDPVINRYGEKPYKPLQLIRNVRLMPAVFFPCTHVVVSERVAGALAALAHIDLNPCEWYKVYDHPVDERAVVEMYTRFSAFSDSSSEWLKKRMHPPGPGLCAFRYFEPVVPVLPDVAGEVDAKTHLELPSPYSDDTGFVTCAELHQRYPLVYAGLYYLCTEEVFRILKPHVNDPAMFSLYTVEVEPAGVRAHAAIRELQLAGRPTPEPLCDVPDALAPRPPDRYTELLRPVLAEVEKVVTVAAQHPAAVEARDAYAAVAADPKAQQLWREYYAMAREFQEARESGVPLATERKEELNAAMRRRLEDPKVSRLSSARFQLSLVLGDIYQALVRRLDPQAAADDEADRPG